MTRPRPSRIVLFVVWVVIAVVVSGRPAFGDVNDGDDRVAIAATATGKGYWVINRYGFAVPFGDAPDLSRDPSPVLHAPAVAAHGTATGRGLFVAAADGGVFTFGDAEFFGSATPLPLNAPVVDIEATGTNAGYWLLAADGGVFAFGDASFLGSAVNASSAATFVAVESTPDDGGYWLRRDDGAVFPFGNASTTVGPASVMRGLRAPIVGMATSPGGDHWLAAADGGVFTFGTSFFGSAADLNLNAPITDIVATPTGEGYWLLGEDGGVFTYGDAAYRGSATNPRGPNAVAESGGEQLLMETGSSCWSNLRGGVCSDTSGPGAHTPRLRVRRGAAITVRFLIDGAPTTVTASTTPWATEHPRAFNVGAANPTTFRVAGPPGDYLLAVSATWRLERPYDTEGGDTSHYLRVRVTP